MGIGRAALDASVLWRSSPSNRGTCSWTIFTCGNVRSVTTPVKGDSRSYSIAAASNVAKVARDRLHGGGGGDLPRLRVCQAHLSDQGPFRASARAWSLPDPPPVIRSGGPGRHAVLGLFPSVSTPRPVGPVGRIACPPLSDYKVSATNYRCRWGEVDIVAMHRRRV